ncbi:hypothetical protein Hanom_Chr14g01274081 [Helianthus anomalus]
MIPLATLRTAQLFQMSWPLTSSIVGNRIGSIAVFSVSFAFAEAGTGAEVLDESSVIV